MTANTKPNDSQTKDNIDEIDLESVLSEIGTQGRVAVSREEPEWCKGHIRTVPIQGSEPITLEWIGKSFGGSKLEIRIYGTGKAALKARRTIEISGPPKDGYGVEVVRGPDGEPVPVTKLQEVRRRYNITHGLGLDFERPKEPEKPEPSFDMSSVLNTMIQAQNTQNQTMISMLVTRISSLETLLQNQTQGGVPAQPIQQVDPLNTLRSTVDTIAQLEQIKKAMGISDQDREPASETGIYTDLIKAFMDLELEKRRAHVAELQVQAQTAPPPPTHAQLPQHVQQPQPPQQSQPPQQPQATGGPAPAPPEQPPQAEELDPELIKGAMGRIESLSRPERLQLASLVLGEPIDDGGDEFEDIDDDPAELENNFTPRQKIENALDSDYNDETGDVTEQVTPECSEPNHEPKDSPARPKSAS